MLRSSITENVVVDDHPNVSKRGVIREARSDRPVASKTDAVLAEGFPQQLGNRAMEFDVPQGGFKMLSALAATRLQW